MGKASSCHCLWSTLTLLSIIEAREKNEAGCYFLQELERALSTLTKKYTLLKTIAKLVMVI